MPDKLNTSPTAPEVPAPNDIIETVKSNSASELNVSFVPAVIVTSPFEDNVPVKFLLTEKLVSVIPEFVAVFKVFTLTFGNGKIETFLFESCNLPRFLVAIVFVETSLPPTAADSCKLVSELIDSIILVRESPAFVVNVIVSPIFNSVVNRVPNPVTVVLELSTEIEPNICQLSP